MDIDTNTIKELIFAGKGDQRNMKQFAKQIGISSSALYRISDGDFRKPLSEDVLRSIADNSVPGSGVTIEKLRIASNFIIDANKAWDDYEKYKQKRKAQAFNIIMRELLSQGCQISRIDPNLDYANGLFHFSISISNHEKHNLAFFNVCDGPLVLGSVRDVTSFLGEIVLCNELRKGDSCEWYYIVFYNDSDEESPFYPITASDRAVGRQALEGYLAGKTCPYNFGIILIDEASDGGESFVSEYVISPNIDSKISIDSSTRIFKAIDSMSAHV